MDASIDKIIEFSKSHGLPEVNEIPILYHGKKVYGVKNPKAGKKSGQHIVGTDRKGRPYMLPHQDVSAICYALWRAEQDS